MTATSKIQNSVFFHPNSPHEDMTENGKYAPQLASFQLFRTVVDDGQAAQVLDFL